MASLRRLPTVFFHPRGTQGYGTSLCNLLTIANAVSHRRRTEVCPLPLPLPVEQNPLAAFLQHQAPTVMTQVARPFEGQPPPPVFAFDLSVLISHGPHCSSCASAETLRKRMGESSLAACYGMRATPDYYGKSVPPDRHLPASGPRAALT